MAGGTAGGFRRGYRLYRAFSYKRQRSHFQCNTCGAEKAVSVGIGLYIAFIGLQNAGLCVDSSATLVTITGFRKNFTTSGICALLTIVGLFITIILYIKKVRGSILMGIVATWVIGMICQLVGLYVPDAESGYNSLFPTMSLTDFQSLAKHLVSALRWICTALVSSIL